MSRQQLTWVALVTFLIGLATVFAINTFEGSNVAMNRDAVRSDLASMAFNAQDWYHKSVVLGGGGTSFLGENATPPDPITFSKIGYTGFSDSDSDIQITNSNGVYTIGNVTAESFTITVVPSSNLTLPEADRIRLIATITSTGITIIQE